MRAAASTTAQTVAALGMSQLMTLLIFTSKNPEGARNLGVSGVSPKVDFITTWLA
jgi:hypothetical protein